MAPSDTDSLGGGDGGKSRMPSPRRRSLRAVFAADVAGFSGRMSLNETSTVSSMSEILLIGRRELEKHSGWLFGMPGDGLFATFESAVSAVQCGLDLQYELSVRTHLRDLPLRIGVHLGEVLIDNDLPYGETLNIAARLESLADPGGILVSGTVMDAVSARVSATFEERGTPQLKNIPRRIPTFAVKPPPARSPVDQTQVGLSNLDRTTRLDRKALREMRNQHATVEIAERDGGQQPLPPVEQPVEDTIAQAEPTESRAAQPITDAAKTQTLVEKLADMSPATAEQRPADPGPVLPPVNQAPKAPVIAAPPLEKTLPEIVELPGVTKQKTSSSGPSKDFLDQITLALAVHAGPFAKKIVERHMKANPNVFELILKLEMEIPNDEERLAFRVRASRINASKDTDEL